MAIIQLDKVFLRYSDNIVFNRLDLKVESGHCCGINTGVLDGGSSLLKLAGGFISPTRGSVYLNGKQISDYSDDELFATVTLCPETGGFVSIFQNFNNIYLPIVYHNHRPPEQVKEEIYRVCEALGVGELLEKEPQQLNDVQQRLFNLAKALVIRPKVLLIDEIQSGLSIDLRSKVLNILNEHKNRYKMTILMTLSAGDDASLADVVYSIRDKKAELIT